MKETSDLLSIEDAANRLGLSISSVQKFCQSGALPARKIAGVWLIRISDLAAIKDRKTKPGPEKK